MAFFNCPKKDKMQGRASSKKRSAKRIASALPGILEDIASGQSLRQACAARELSHGAVLTAIMQKSDIYEAYRKAWACRIMCRADEIMEIADNVVPEMTAIQKAKLRTDNLKWLLSRLCRDMFGDSVELKGNAMPTVINVIRSAVDPLQGIEEENKADIQDKNAGGRS